MKTKDLTSEDVHVLEGFEHFTEEEMQKIIDSLKELSLLCYDSYMNNIT